MTVGWIRPRGTAADWRGRRDARLSSAGDAEAVARWIEANLQRDPESVARVQAARDALAELTADDLAQALAADRADDVGIDYRTMLPEAERLVALLGLARDALATLTDAERAEALR